MSHRDDHRHGSGPVRHGSPLSVPDNICQEESLAENFLPLTLGGIAVGALVPPGTTWRQIYGRPAP